MTEEHLREKEQQLGLLIFTADLPLATEFVQSFEQLPREDPDIYDRFLDEWMERLSGRLVR